MICTQQNLYVTMQPLFTDVPVPIHRKLTTCLVLIGTVISCPTAADCCLEPKSDSAAHSFRREVDENSALLVCYVACSGNSSRPLRPTTRCVMAQKSADLDS